MLEREIQKSILADFKRKKVIVLLGARQAGKTTLLLSLALLRLIWQMKSMNRQLGVCWNIICIRFLYRNWQMRLRKEKKGDCWRTG